MDFETRNHTDTDVCTTSTYLQLEQVGASVAALEIDHNFGTLYSGHGHVWRYQETCHHSALAGAGHHTADQGPGMNYL